MDKKTFRRSCCNCQTMLILFGVIFLVVGLLTFYLFRQIKQIDFSPSRVFLSTVSRESFMKKLQIDPQSNPELKLMITSEELSSALSSDLSGTGFEIREMRAQIEEDGVTLYGQLTKPLRSNLTIEANPEVLDDQIEFKVEKISAGKLTLPGLLNSEIEKALNKIIDERFASLYENYQIQRIELEKDQMIILGKLKMEAE